MAPLPPPGYAYVLRWKTASTAFVVLSFNFQVRRYSPTFAMSLVCTLPLFVSRHQHAWRNLFESGGAQVHAKNIENFCGLN